MRRGISVWVLSLLLGTVGLAQPGALPVSKPLPPGWENVTEKLWRQIPDYQHDPQWYNRRVGTIHVDNIQGDLYVTLCARWGTYRSRDCGETWMPVNATAVGRQVENRGVCSNPVTGDFVLFKVKGGPPTQSAIVLDHGNRWLLVASDIGDGFRCGVADWSRTPPPNLLAIRHHHDGLYLSEDSGKSWKELPRHGGYGAAMLSPDELFLAFLQPAVGSGEGQKTESPVPKWRAKSLAKDIMLTTNQCQTFRKVGEFNPRSETPAGYGEDLFWIAAEGVMVTRDRGRSWNRMGQPITDLMYGPFFGSNKDTMVVVSNSGFFKTTDAGANWTKLADLVVPEGLKIELAHPGWDPMHNAIYLGFLGDDVYRCRLPSE